MKKYILIALLMTVQTAFSQKIKVLIDCPDGCDFDFIRREITLVDYVHERREADIHALFVRQASGNGGDQYSLQLYSPGRNDTLQFFTAATATADDIRKQLVSHLKAGLIPYLAKTQQLGYVEISMTNPTVEGRESTSDKWNHWIFSIGARGRFSGDKNYRERDLSINISASRVTPFSRLEFHFFNSQSKNAYAIDELDVKSWLITGNSYLEAEQEYVKSISGHWSWSLESRFSKSSFDNLRAAITGAGGLEYDIFPYAASANKFAVIRFQVEAAHRNYVEETIFGREQETLFSGTLGAYTCFTQPWGNISSGISWYNYFHDFSKNNLSLDANIELKVARGISVSFFGTGSLINDQLSLPASGASPREVLLRLKALSTSFNYYTGIGINYRFGSQFNNYVNPRFRNRP